MLKDLLILDIETVPQYAHYEDMPPMWQKLWEDKVSRQITDKDTPAELYRQKGGILAEFGRIVCISTAIFPEGGDDVHLRIKSFYGDDEAEILHHFIAIADKMHARNPYFQFAGHNIKEFDIPYICRRMLINHMPLPDYLLLSDKKPWEVKMTDTMNWWKFGDNKNYVSLHLLATVLGIPTSKDDIDGSMVQDVYYQEKNLERIVTYCQKDVVVSANIILRYMSFPLLNNEQVSIVGKN